MKKQNIIQPIRHHLQPLALAACAVLGLASSASAVTWINGAGGPLSWETATNWSPASVPVAGDYVEFERGSGLGTITMNTDYSTGTGLNWVYSKGGEIVDIASYLKTSSSNGLRLVNGGGGPALWTVLSGGTIQANISLSAENTRPAPVLNFTGGNWVSGNVTNNDSGRQKGIIKVSSATGSLTPGAVVFTPTPNALSSQRPGFEFVLATTGVAPIAFSHATDPLQLTGGAAGTNPYTLTVDAALYAGVGGDIPLITHSNDADRLFSAGNITIANAPAGKGAFVTQTNLGTTLTLTNAVDWSGSATPDTQWATAGNWGGTVPGATLDNTIANFPTGVASDRVTVTLDGTSPTLAVLNINSGAVAASAYSIGQGTSGTINLGATPTGSAFAAAQINVLKGTVNSISAPVSLTMDAQVYTAASTSLAMSGPISGAYSLTKGGTGTLVLSGGAHTYSGATIIPAGTLSVSTLASAGSPSDLGAYLTPGAAGIVLNSSAGTPLIYTGNTVSVDRGFTASGPSGPSASVTTINVATNGQTLTLGDSAINIPSGGMYSFRATGGANTTLALGAVTSSVVGEVGLFGSTANLKLASFTGAGVTRLDLYGLGSNGGNAITGDITMSGSTGIRLGNGGVATNWTLSGNNTFSGRVEIQGGNMTLTVTNPLSLGNNTGNGSNSTVYLDGTLKLLNDTSTNFVKNVYLPGNGEPTIHVGKAVGGTGSDQTHTLGDVTYNGGNLNWNFSGDSGYGLTVGNVKGHLITNNLGAPGILTLASLSFVNTWDNSVIQGTGNTLITGAVTGPGPNALFKDGAGTLTLQGVNTYTASTTVSGGKLVMGNALALQYSAYDTTGSNGTTIGVDLNGITTPILGGLSGSVDLASAMIGYSGVTGLTLQPQSGSVTYSGIIANGAGNTTLTKTSAGTQILSGANSYTGGTIVNAGTLRLDGAFNMPATGTLQVNGSGNFSLADGTSRATSTAALGLASGANLTFDWVEGAVDTLTSTAAATTVAGPVGISINPLTSPSGSPLTLISAPSGLGAATYYLANNTGFTATLAQSDTAVTIGSYAAVTAPTLLFWQGNKVAGVNSAGLDNALALSSGTASNWSTAQGSYTATGVVPGSTADVIFSTTDSPAQQSTVMGANMTVKSVTFHDATAVTIGGNHNLTLTSTSGTAGNGTGGGFSAITVTTTAADPTISANVLLGANQTWHVAAAKTLTVGGAVSGPFNLTKNSAGTLILNGTNNYNGTTTITDGKLFVNGDQSSATGTVTVNGGKTLGGTGTIGGNVTIQNTGRLAFNLITTAASHDKLELATGKTLTFSGASVLDITGGGTAASGSYTLVYAPGGISGSVPATINLPDGWSGASVSIVDGKKLVLTVIVPGSSDPYDTWALVGTGDGAFDADANNDGVANGMAWMLGATDKNANATSLLPTVSQSGGGLVLTFDCLSAANRGTAVLNVQHSSDLDIIDPWADALVPGTEPENVTVSGVNFVTSANTPLIHVVATIPAGNAVAGKLFGRLNVQKAP